MCNHMEMWRHGCEVSKRQRATLNCWILSCNVITNRTRKWHDEFRCCVWRGFLRNTEHSGQIGWNGLQLMSCLVKLVIMVSWFLPSSHLVCLGRWAFLPIVCVVSIYNAVNVYLVALTAGHFFPLFVLFQFTMLSMCVWCALTDGHFFPLFVLFQFTMLSMCILSELTAGNFFSLFVLFLFTMLSMCIWCALTDGHFFPLFVLFQFTMLSMCILAELTAGNFFPLFVLFQFIMLSTFILSKLTDGNFFQLFMLLQFTMLSTCILKSYWRPLRGVWLRKWVCVLIKVSNFEQMCPSVLHFVFGWMTFVLFLLCIYRSIFGLICMSVDIIHLPEYNIILFILLRYY